MEKGIRERVHECSSSDWRQQRVSELQSSIPNDFNYMPMKTLQIFNSEHGLMVFPWGSFGGMEW